MLPTMAARATVINKNFMMNTFGESCRNQRWTLVWIQRPAPTAATRDNVRRVVLAKNGVHRERERSRMRTLQEFSPSVSF